MPVVLGSEAGGTMIHEAVGHGLESDLALANLSVYSGKLGQAVAAPKITNRWSARRGRSNARATSAARNPHGAKHAA